jgi:hypothetical protein
MILYNQMSIETETKKTLYTSREWSALTRAQRKDVMRKQRKHKHSTSFKQRKKNMRKQYLSESEREILAAMPEYVTLKEQYHLLTKTMRYSYYQYELMNKLKNFGIQIKGTVPEPHELRYEYDNHQPHATSDDVVIEVNDNYRVRNDENYPSDDPRTVEFMEAERVKLHAFVDELTQHRIESVQAHDSYNDLCRSYNILTDEYHRRVNECLQKKMSVYLSTDNCS